MNKVLIEVSSPAAGKTFDMFVPDSLQIGEFAELASNLFSKVSCGTFSCRNRLATVCEKKEGCVIDWNQTFKEAGIKNGTKLIIF